MRRPSILIYRIGAFFIYSKLTDFVLSDLFFSFMTRQVDFSSERTAIMIEITFIGGVLLFGVSNFMSSQHYLTGEQCHASLLADIHFLLYVFV